jgi:hypothetical protein
MKRGLMLSGLVTAMLATACQQTETQVDILVEPEQEPTPFSAYLIVPENGFYGPLRVKVGFDDREIHTQVFRFWMSGDDTAVYFAVPHNLSGYEAEGMGVWRWNAEMAEPELVFNDDFVIENVAQVTSPSGREALVVMMTDGGLGAPHVAIADPDRGRVFRSQMSTFLTTGTGEVEISKYEEPDIRAG